MWDTENSFFAVMDRDVFGSTPIPDLHRFIRNKCIVIREDHISSPTFDEGSLSNVADLDVVLPVHGACLVLFSRLFVFETTQ